MNCFWNCSSHAIEGIEESDNVNIYEKTQGNKRGEAAKRANIIIIIQQQQQHKQKKRKKNIKRNKTFFVVVFLCVWY